MPELTIPDEIDDSRVPPRERNTERGPIFSHPCPAWKVLIDPQRYGQQEMDALLDRGFDFYTVDGDIQGHTVVGHAEKFAINSIKAESPHETLSSPWVPRDQPGRLALISSMGSWYVKHHPRFEGKKQHRLQLHEEIHEALLGHIRLALYPEYEWGDALFRNATEALLRVSEWGEHGPPAGRPVESLEPHPETGKLAAKMPVVHAHRHLVTESDAAAEQFVVQDNYVFVPTDSLDQRFYSHVVSHKTNVAQTLRDAVEQRIGANKLGNGVSICDRLDEELLELQRTHNEERIYASSAVPDKLWALLQVIEHAPDDIATLGEPVSASDLYQALQFLQEMDLDNSLVSKRTLDILSELDSPRGVGNMLSHYKDHKALTTVNAGKSNLYKFQKVSGSGFKQIEVTQPEDLRELPCISNLHDHLKQSKPRRYPLYTYARLLLSLENDFSVEEIKEAFSEYPWYDPDITEKQVRYEKNRRLTDSETGEQIPPQPVSCNSENKKFTQYCIGRRNCDYNLYSSLNLKPEVYNNL